MTVSSTIEDYQKYQALGTSLSLKTIGKDHNLINI